MKIDHSIGSLKFLIVIFTLFGILYISLFSMGLATKGWSDSNSVNLLSKGTFLDKSWNSPKLSVMNQQKTFFFQIDTNNISSQSIPYDDLEPRTCGSCSGNFSFPLSRWGHLSSNAFIPALV